MDLNEKLFINSCFLNDLEMLSEILKPDMGNIEMLPGPPNGLITYGQVG